MIQYEKFYTVHAWASSWCWEGMKRISDYKGFWRLVMRCGTVVQEAYEMRGCWVEIVHFVGTKHKENEIIERNRGPGPAISALEQEENTERTGSSTWNYMLPDSSPLPVQSRLGTSVVKPKNNEGTKSTTHHSGAHLGSYREGPSRKRDGTMKSWGRSCCTCGW